jgi:hypothetical protein
VPYTIGDDVRMAVETSFGIAIRCFVACQVPDNKTFISTSREEHIWTIELVSIYRLQCERQRTFRGRWLSW